MQTILAVDDKEENLIKIEQILSGEYQVIAVNSRAMALKFLNQRLPDLVLINMEMPRMEGLQLYVEMKKNEEWERLPVEYIVNPFDADDLQRKVEGQLLFDSKEDDSFLPVIRNGKIEEIPVEQIECIEIYNQISIVRLQYQELQTRMLPEHMKKRLGDRFLSVGAGLLVNKKFISRVSHGILYMKNGKELVLPLEDRKKLVDRINQVLTAR